MRERTPVQGLRRHGRWVEVVTTSEGTFSAAAVVVALGARINDLLLQVGVGLPIVGGKGYSVDLHGAGTVPLRALYLMEPKIGLSPYAEGVLRAAGIFELPGTDDTARVRRVRQIVDESLPFLRDWHPVADGWEMRGRAGLRPCTPDSLPFLGPVPGAEGLYVATGHGMLGVTLAPATGEVMADMILSRKIPETTPAVPADRAALTVRPSRGSVRVGGRNACRPRYKWATRTRPDRVPETGGS